MSQKTREEIVEESRKRRERILAFMTQDPPVPLNNIATMEGMAERACRDLVKELEKEHGIRYIGYGSRPGRGSLPFGLTSATTHLRGRLADHLYALRERGNNHGSYGRLELAPIIGMNPRQQRRAEEKPFAHDWTLGQIERLARAHGRDPMEFLLTCLTT